jgi:hypothetical protein
MPARRLGPDDADHACRNSQTRAALLGIAGDIIATVALQPVPEDRTVSGGIVLTTTVLSFSMEPAAEQP